MGASARSGHDFSPPGPPPGVNHPRAPAGPVPRQPRRRARPAARRRLVRPALPHQRPDAGGRARGQGVEVVPALEEGDAAPGGRERNECGGEVGDVPALSPRSVSGSSRCASNPADRRSQVGSNEVVNGPAMASAPSFGLRAWFVRIAPRARGGVHCRRRMAGSARDVRLTPASRTCRQRTLSTLTRPWNGPGAGFGSARRG